MMTKWSCVVVGTFNIYIFQPNWVAKVLGLSQDNELHWQTDLSRPGFKVSFDQSDSEIVVRPDRVVISSTSRDKPLESAIEQILNRLPETPLEAIGVNFDFDVPLTKFKPELQENISIIQDEKYGSVNRAIAATCSLESRTLNLSASMNANAMISKVTSNVHFNVKDMSNEERIEIVRSFCDQIQFVQDCVQDIWLEGENA